MKNSGQRSEEMTAQVFFKKLAEGTLVFSGEDTTTPQSSNSASTIYNELMAEAKQKHLMRLQEEGQREISQEEAQELAFELLGERIRLSKQVKDLEQRLAESQADLTKARAAEAAVAKEIADAFTQTEQIEGPSIN